MEANQEDVFKLVGMKALKNALDGYNSTIFAYGQTGSGKTFTLTGGPEKYSDRGIIPRTISTLFSEFRKRTDAHFKIYVSYLELYNEQGYDLLDSKHDTKSLDDLPKVMILEDDSGNYHLKNLSLHPADNEEEALNLLFMGDTNRAVAETPMNMASSRSHCIFSIAIECRLLNSDKVRRSKLHLVDLAGSERVSKTQATGGVLKEARYINTSLFYLEMVIVALYEKATRGRAHVPYRNSIMTSVLRDSLGGNCKTVMVATINPESAQTEESISTCRFAQRVSLIKNKATINEDADPAVVIQRLKGEMLNLREEIQFLKGESGEGDALMPNELADLKQNVVSYCDCTDSHSQLAVGKLTLTKIKDIFGIFKNVVLEARCAGGGAVLETQTDSMAQQQIDNLKSLLLQRDNEIAILVNMVKKNKQGGGGGGGGGGEYSDSASAGLGLGLGLKDGRSSGDSRSTTIGGGGGNGNLSNSNNNNNNTSVGRSNKDDVIIKRHLFGVPPPVDAKILEDAATSFEYFRDRCSLNQSMEENRELLKEKINEAKVLGERANQSRGTINYLKSSIETIRKEKALSKLSTAATGPGAKSEVYIYICIHVYIYAYMYIYIHTCVYICIHVYIYVYIYVYAYMCVYIYIYAYMCICICIYTCVYTSYLFIREDKDKFIILFNFNALHIYVYVYVYFILCINIGVP